MTTNIVKIGNSQGLIIPKKLLNTLGDSKEVEIQATDAGLLITPVCNTPRANWEKQFYEAIQNGHAPESETDHIENEFDKEEWKW